MENKNNQKTEEVVLLKESTRQGLISLLSINLEATQESKPDSMEDSIHKTMMTKSLQQLIKELNEVTTVNDTKKVCEGDCNACTLKLLMSIMTGEEFDCPGKQQEADRPKSRRVNVAYDNNMN